MSAIQLLNVSRHWGDVRAVDDVSFEVEQGTMLVLLGPSGCGKSTTLRLIAGLESVTSGRIMIGERDVTHLPPAQRQLAMVFQSYALFPHLTVRENILFGLTVRKVPEAEREKRLTRAVDILGLSALLQRKPGELSGGQQQRVALGRALVAEAAVCLMDEPLSNLDAKLRHEMRREIRALQQTLGMTMVYVTHDQTEAMSMADRIILMQGGRIVQNATPSELYSRPATTFAGNFIGTPPMNLVRLDDARGSVCVAGSRSGKVGVVDSANYVLGIRPEHVRIVPDGWRAVVESVEYLGSSSVLGCRVGGEELSVVVDGVSDIAVGAEIYLHCPDEHIHIFDAQTGERRGTCR
ncbi:sn-glycerol-3-phosphate import ATP-binding protein UgpC [anaerobic digester metagenome]|uniref:ABC transporter ATP-binding protein n=1 Tax=Nitratidesulfovibrio liaohensis TaxID=2604158 RepID=A0ABY9R380_9BACT|nr:ABC transporter ATP-binding protein [Nitratidesulfovibrio liaohensis]NHZ45988.1 ABC transporter ATP-binding protein [Nitratidesulfovibrio liaohensis]WMW66216.1 ABC transporter ATP-binding protein [Nitratidesulfovibrio liaohensis]